MKLIGNFTLLFAVVVFFVGTGVRPAVGVDHTLYDQILGSYVEGGFFDYRSFDNHRSDREKLDRYLEQMSRVRPESLSEPEALAFWINLYNAATLQLIADNYPVDGIRDLGGWFSTPWEKSFIPVNDRTLTLDQIEHEIIRVRFDEPRIHFALVCAAHSCPPLRDEAYVTERLDQQLNDQARLFLNSDKNRFVVKNGRLQVRLSRIFSWYGEDFGGERGVLDYVSQFLPEVKAALIREGSYQVEYISYDWGLNQAPGPYPDRGS